MLHKDRTRGNIGFPLPVKFCFKVRLLILPYVMTPLIHTHLATFLLHMNFLLLLDIN